MLAFCDFYGLFGGRRTGEISLITNHKTRTCSFEKLVAFSFLGFVSLTFALFTPPANAAQFYEVRGIVAPTNAMGLIYSPGHNSLVIKNAASAIMMINIGTQSSTTHFSNCNLQKDYAYLGKKIIIG